VFDLLQRHGLLICPSGKSSLQVRAIPPHKRGVSRSSRTRGGLRWTRQRFACDGIAGRVERLLSDHRHADERCSRGRQNRVVLTPRRWRQVLRSCVGPTGLRQNLIRRRRWQNSPVTGRARHKLLKPLRAGMPGDSGVLVVTRVRSITTIAHEAAGAAGTRHSPRPPWGREIHAQLGRIAPRGREVMFGIGADTVIPGRCQRVRAKRGPMTGSGSNPESRDSGSGPADHPGMTAMGLLAV
jgi:hypothetical protein